LSWRIKSLLISLAANALFFAMWGVLGFGLVPGLYPAFLVCNALDPGNQPYAPACGGWHATAATTGGAITNVILYWLIIWAVAFLMTRRSAKAS